MYKLEEFKQLIKDFSDVADFLVIYIAEAHSTDGWAFTNNFDINQHRSLEERLSAAQIVVQKEPLCPVVVDEMNDITAIKYGALPERLYVLQAGGAFVPGEDEIRRLLTQVKLCTCHPTSLRGSLCSVGDRGCPLCNQHILLIYHNTTYFLAFCNQAHYQYTTTSTCSSIAAVQHLFHQA